MHRILLALLLLPISAQAALENTLGNNPSPYLAMHGTDPVAWQEWNTDAVMRAKAENKLLYVSIGYFACHWCHVMQQESYQAADVAELLNRDFIPVKVDRELNPALDARLIEFVESTRGYSGWPLNVFITPEGHPLLGIVYLPHDDFRDLVTRLAAVWKTDATNLKHDAAQAAGELAPRDIDLSGKPSQNIAKETGDKLVTDSLLRGDLFLGGFGEQSKFPSAPRLDALLSQFQLHGDVKLGEFLRTTLDHMQDYGLYDVLGGGFYRYTVDPQWRVPHFEKMLYDNALLASLYFRAAKLFDDPRYLQTALETTAFMRDTLGTKSGAMIASLSAVDANNVEGGYYLWDLEEVKKTLSTQEWQVAEQAWDLSGSPTLEGLYLPMAATSLAEVATATGLDEARVMTLLAKAKAKLLRARGQRVLPKDVKRISAWNGLALSALIMAAQHSGDRKDITVARQVRDFLVNEMWDGKRLLRAKGWKGEVIGNATLEDYAYVAQGLYDLARYTGEDKDVEIAEAVTLQAWQRFFGQQGWRLSEQNLLAYGGSEPLVADGPMPSPSAVVIRVSQALKLDDKRVAAALAAAQDSVLDDPFWFASYVDAFAANEARH